MTVIKQTGLPSRFSPYGKKTIIEQCNYPSLQEVCFYCYGDPETFGNMTGGSHTVAVFTVRPKKEVQS